MNRWMPLLIVGLALWMGCKPADPVARGEGFVAGRAWSAELAAAPDSLDAEGDLARLGDSLQVWAAKLAPSGEGSAIAGVNAQAGSRSGSMDRATYDLLMRCFRYKKDSDGAIDFLAGPLRSVWGLQEADPALDRPEPTPAQIDTALTLVRDGGIFVVDLGVLLSLKGMSIDLDPLLEGVLCDHAARWLHARGYPDLRLSVGGATRCAGMGPGREPWTVELADGKGGPALASLEPGARSLATLNTLSRAVVRDGRSVVGVIDPRTGLPGGVFEAVWVLAPDAERAQVWAQALWLDGEEALPRMEAQGGLAAAWLDAAGELHRSGDFPETRP